MSAPSNVTPMRPATTAAPEDLRETVRAEMEAGALSISQVAREVGRGASQATLSQWLRGEYGGDVAAVEERMRRWLETRRATAERDLSGAGLDRWVETGTAGEIALACAHAQAAADVACVVGRSGAGKTTALKRYCATHSAAYYCAASPAVRTLSGLLARVAGAIGAGAQHPSAGAAEAAVIERLEGRRAMFVMDEAHHLNATLLDELRCVRDLAGCGLVLAGGEALWMTLNGPRCDQILGRIGVRVALGAIPNADAMEIAGAVLGRAPGGGARKAVLDSARAPGGLHALRRRLARAWAFAHASGRDRISDDDVVDAGEVGA